MNQWHRQARGEILLLCFETYKMLKLIRTISQDHRIGLSGFGRNSSTGFRCDICLHAGFVEAGLSLS